MSFVAGGAANAACTAPTPNRPRPSAKVRNVFMMSPFSILSVMALVHRRREIDVGRTENYRWIRGRADVQVNGAAFRVHATVGVIRRGRPSAVRSERHPLAPIETLTHRARDDARAHLVV